MEVAEHKNQNKKYYDNRKKSIFRNWAVNIDYCGGVWLASREGEKTQEKLSKPMMGEKMPDEGAIHVARGAAHEPYGTNPPTSGPHWVDTAGPGIKDCAGCTHFLELST